VQQATVDAVGPVVVGADEVPDAAARLVEESRAAVPAHVVEGAQLLVVTATVTKSPGSGSSASAAAKSQCAAKIARTSRSKTSWLV
jgi:hypothetical protein